MYPWHNPHLMLDLMKVYLPLKQLMANNCNLFSENYYLLKDDVLMIYVVWYWYKRGLLVNYVYYNSRVYANFGTWCSAVIRNYIIYWDRDPVAWGVCVCVYIGFDFKRLQGLIVSQFLLLLLLENKILERELGKLYIKYSHHFN